MNLQNKMQINLSHENLCYKWSSNLTRCTSSLFVCNWYCMSKVSLCNCCCVSKVSVCNCCCVSKVYVCNCCCVSKVSVFNCRVSRFEPHSALSLCLTSSELLSKQKSEINFISRNQKSRIWPSITIWLGLTTASPLQRLLSIFGTLYTHVLSSNKHLYLC